MGKEYVAGFLFKDDDTRVLVIRKSHPEWQKGKLNGIGGKIEDGETPEQAMRREFLEEAGIHVPDWREFCVLQFEHGEITVHFLRATWEKSMKEPRSITEEPVMWKASVIFEWPANEGFVENLSWLIPLAKDQDILKATVTN